MKKIRELIDQVGKPSLGPRPNGVDDITISPPKYFFHDDSRQFATNPQADREAIENIEEVYYKSASDVVAHELNKLPDKTAVQIINNRKKILQQQHSAVSKKLSDVILENQPSYTKELKDVQELQRSLHNAFVICSNGRRFLMSVYVRSSEASLALLSNQQKRQTLLTLLDSLQTIKTLQHTDVRLREILEEEDYAGAIQLCFECQTAAETYRHYHCIKDLSSKLQDTVEQIEEQVDVALSKSCKSFDKSSYTKLQMAYHLLGKTQSAMDQLLMHYTSSIHNTAFQVVLGFAELASPGQNLQKKQYKDLCQHITKDFYIPCLMELCKALWSVMNCYYKTCRWHKEEFGVIADGDIDREVVEYVNRKLQHGHHRVWSDVQSRIRTYILSSDLSFFSYDEFIVILDIVKRFILIGEEFCQADDTETQQITDNLNEPLRKQTLSYFYSHHHGRIEELIMFLENESWQPCPVKSSFDVFGMQEFRFLKPSFSSTSSTSSNPGQDETTQGSKYFHPFSTKGHPLADLEKLSQNPNSQNSTQAGHNAYDDFSEDEEETADELLRDYVDERTGEVPMSSSSSAQSIQSAGFVQQGPILTNTALHVLRLCGSYLKMCDVLKPIAVDVVVCMSQLFDLYFFAVYEFFSSPEGRGGRLNERLTPTIQRIEESLFLPENNGASEAEPASVHEKKFSKFRKPVPCALVDLSSPASNYGITERVVATESLVCLAEQFQHLQKNLEQMIPQTKKAFLHQFYSQTVRAASDVRGPAYLGVASHAVRYSETVERMSSVNWDVKDIMSQHNFYVDQLLHELKAFKTSLTASVTSVQMPEAVSRVIWQHCVHYSNYAFVEGFSNVKKCSNEGRALMQLDYQQFLMKLEKLTNIRPIPNREFVEAYIKAYYLTESDLESWMKCHPEYSAKQLSSLVSCSASSYSGSNRKTKQKMMSLIDELTNRK
uniref:Coiled-coil domain-containing protein 132 n=1 Tax=Phallusia mammillata TaxID=59560 RepID=A0A6F9D993_9ASCI|nr:coiled-coil domain-containing protein 132 [Phallusia mammillata]